MSEFKFSPHKPAEGESKIHGLVDVYDRETGEHWGMMNPIKGGGYVLRNTEGVRLSEISGVSDVTYTSRETSARGLRVRVRQIKQRAEDRALTVSAECPNLWHETAPYRAGIPCPECPSQLGLKVALAAIEDLRGGLDAADTIRDLIYVRKD